MSRHYPDGTRSDMTGPNSPFNPDYDPPAPLTHTAGQFVVFSYESYEDFRVDKIAIIEEDCNLNDEAKFFAHKMHPDLHHDWHLKDKEWRGYTFENHEGKTFPQFLEERGVIRFVEYAEVYMGDHCFSLDQEPIPEFPQDDAA